MRPLIVLLMRYVLRTSIGRWVVILLMLGIGALFFALYPQAASESKGDGLTALLTGIFATLFGLAVLALQVRIMMQQRRAKQGNTAKIARMQELKAQGRLLLVPAAPSPPQGTSPDTIAQIDGYAKRMKALPWGVQPTVSEFEAKPLFDETVAHVHGARGDWSVLSEPINTFLTLPAPYCYIGAAEVMYQLSYLRGWAFAPNGLRQGLFFIVESQVVEPEQPDALVIRTKLLAGTRAPRWLELAEQTLEVLRRVAPQHRRLPEAEQALYIKQGKLEEALACLEQIIERPPSPQDAFGARNIRATLLMDMKRNDESLVAYREMVSIRPDDAWAWHNMSVLLDIMGRYQEALDCNTRALSIMNFGIAHERRASILAKLSESGPA